MYLLHVAKASRLQENWKTLVGKTVLTAYLLKIHIFMFQKFELF